MENLMIDNKKAVITEKDKVLEWRNRGIKFFQFTDEQINNPSKRKGYVGKRCGLKVYVI